MNLNEIEKIISNALTKHFLVSSVEKIETVPTIGIIRTPIFDDISCSKFYRNIVKEELLKKIKNVYVSITKNDTWIKLYESITLVYHNDALYYAFIILENECDLSSYILYNPKDNRFWYNDREIIINPQAKEDIETRILLYDNFFKRDNK